MRIPPPNNYIVTEGFKLIGREGIVCGGKLLLVFKYYEPQEFFFPFYFPLISGCGINEDMDQLFVNCDLFLTGYGLWWQIDGAMNQYHTVFIMNAIYILVL